MYIIRSMHVEVPDVDMVFFFMKECDSDECDISDPFSPADVVLPAPFDAFSSKSSTRHLQHLRVHHNPVVVLLTLL